MVTSASHGTALIATAISAGFVLFAGPRTTALRATAVLAAVAQVLAIVLGALPPAALVMTAGTAALPWLRHRAIAAVAGGLVAVLLAFFAAGDLPAAGHHGADAPGTGRYALTVTLWLAVTAGLGAAARLAALGRWLAFPVVVATSAAIVAVPAGQGPGTPVVAAVNVAGQRLPVLVAPGRPGWNLVHVGARDVSVAGVAATARPGAGDSWAEVWLPAGPSRISFTHRGSTGSVEIDTGDRAGPDLRGPDGPECAHSALGTVIGGKPVPLEACPADALSPADAAGLRAVVGFVADRGGTAVGLLGDSSPRGRRAAEVVREEAARRVLTVAPPGSPDPLIIVSGWQDAGRVLTEIGAGRMAAQGTYLAPWLMNTTLLTPPAGQVVVSRFHPGDPDALGYLGALHTHFPGDVASTAGYAGWGGPQDTSPRLFAASKLYVPSPVQDLQATTGHGHHGGRGWLPDGSIVPITGPLGSA
jgi:hypothetical protein